MKTLRHLELSGYKSIENVKIDLNSGINVFIGPNGSGKSNLMNFINIVADEAPSIDNSFKANLTWSVGNDLYNRNIEQQIPISNKSFTKNKLDLKSIDDFLRDRNKRLNVLITKNNEEVYSQTDISLSAFQLDFLSKFLADDNYSLNTNLVGFYTDPNIPFLKYPSGFTMSTQEVLKTTANLPLFRYTIILPILGSGIIEKKGDIENLSELLNASLSSVSKETLEYIRQYSPLSDFRFKEIVRIKKQDGKRVLDNLQVEFEIDGFWYNWEDLSDGTQRILRIIDSVISSSEIVLLEEPELGVHPHQLMLLMEFLTEMSEEKQIIISTHSPDVLEYVTPLENINVVSIKKGKTQVRKLTKKQREKAQVYLEDTGSIGDYWRHSDLEI